MIPISPPKLLVSKLSAATSPATVSSKDDTLERNILSMASMDLPTAIQSMNAIENVCISLTFEYIKNVQMFEDFREIFCISFNHCDFFKIIS